MAWHPSLVSKNLLPNGWQLCPPGAGGFATCGEMAPDGTLVIRTDTAGAYLWNVSQWEQLATASRLPAQLLSASPNSVSGCFDIRVAPSNTSTLYMVLGTGNLFVSQNKGKSFVEAAGFGAHSMNPNVASGLNNHFCGFHMAVDPANDAIAYLCTDSDGVYFTTDYINWQLLSTALVPANAEEPTTNQYGPGIVQFDPTSSVVGGVTQHFWISSYGNGLYETTNGGGTFTNISDTTGPKKIWRMECAIDGTLWVCTPPTLAGNGSVYKYKSGTWTQVASGGTINGTLHDPNNANNVWLYNCGGTVQFSADAGATVGGVSAAPTRTATDLPWLAATSEGYMSAGRMFFDTQVDGRVWFTEGIGVWNTENLTQTGAAQVWTSCSIGINNLVPNRIVCPPVGGGAPIVVSWDRAIFTLDSLVLSEGSNQRWDTNTSIALGFDVDYCKDNPSNLVSLSWNMSNGAASNPGTSADGGHTWATFPTKPQLFGQDVISYGALGGSIAAAATGNYLWAPGQGGDPFYTKDGGETWNHIDLSTFGVVLANSGRTNNTGWNSVNGYYLKAFSATADHVNVGTFYLYNYGSSGAGAGVYVSTDGGVTWTQQYNGSLAPSWDGWNFDFKSVPNSGSTSTAGHLFYTPGPQTDNPETPFLRSTDGGKTWNAIANVWGVQCFGFGACAEGETYPAIVIVGWVNNQYGIWVSFDDCETWQWRGRFPSEWVDTPSCIDGDKNVVDRWYIGTGGSGYFYYDPTLSLQ